MVRVNGEDNPVYKKFSYDKDKNRSFCLDLNCKYSKEGFSGRHAGNLKKHLKRNHREVFDSVEEEANALDMVRRAETNQAPPKKKRKVEGSIIVKIDKQEVVDACVTLVTENGRPFKMLEDSGMRKLLDPIVEGLGGNFTISRKNIPDYVSERAAKVRQDLRSELKGRFICVKVDGAKRLSRSILGVNIQYVSEGKIHLRTLASLQLKDRQTGFFLKEMVCQVLSEFGIDLKRVYCITTDNGANVVLATKLLALARNQRSSDINNIDDEDDGSLIESLEQQTFGEEGGPKLCGVRCAAHTLQLGIQDAFKEVKMNGIISLVRSACINLRTPNIANMIEDMNLQRPSLDCPTRWCSFYDMSMSLVKLKPFCDRYSDAHPDLSFSEEEWEDIIELNHALEPAKVATKIFQLEQLTLGDFYGAWLTCKLETKKIGTPFASALVKALEKREKTLISTDVFAAGILLDPRYNKLLSKDDIKLGKKHLNALWKAIIGFSANEGAEEAEKEVDPADPSSDSSSEEEDELEKLLASKDSIRPGARKKPNHKIDSIIDTFLKEPRVNKKENILSWWYAKRFTHPLLYSLSEVALAVPPTQVSVERLFSGLKFTLSYLRDKLGEDSLDDIMLIRINSLFNV